MKNKFSRTIASAILALTLFCNSIAASAATSRYPDAYGQNMDYWCWAASAKMVGENNGGVNSSIDRSQKLLPDTNDIGLHNPYYGYYYSGSTKKFTADGVQYAIVRYVKGNTSNSGGSDTEKQTALQYVSGDTMSVGTKGRYNVVMSDSLLEEIQYELSQGRYVIGNVLDENYKNGHSIIIKGYYEPEDKYMIFDPWNKFEDKVSGVALFETYGYQYLNNCLGRVSWFQYCR